MRTYTTGREHDEDYLRYLRECLPVYERRLAREQDPDKRYARQYELEQTRAMIRQLERDLYEDRDLS